MNPTLQPDPQWKPTHWRALVIAICLFTAFVFLAQMARLGDSGQQTLNQWRSEADALNHQIAINERNGKP